MKQACEIINNRIQARMKNWKRSAQRNFSLLKKNQISNLSLHRVFWDYFRSCWQQLCAFSDVFLIIAMECDKRYRSAEGAFFICNGWSRLTQDPPNLDARSAQPQEIYMESNRSFFGLDRQGGTRDQEKQSVLLSQDFPRLFVQQFLSRSCEQIRLSSQRTQRTKKKCMGPGKSCLVWPPTNVSFKHLPWILSIKSYILRVTFTTTLR